MAPTPLTSAPRAGRARRRRIAVIAIVLVALVAALFYPEAFSISRAHVNLESTWLLFLLSALSFLAIVILSIVLLRQVLKLYAERRANVLGAKFKTKLVAGALGLSLIPVVCMFGFTYGLINRTLDKWFSRPVEAVRDDTSQLATLLETYIEGAARGQAISLAQDSDLQRDLRFGALVPASAVLASHRAALAGGFALVADGSRRVSASYGLPETAAEHPDSLPLLGNRSSGPARVAGNPYLLATAPVPGASYVVVVGMPVPPALAGRVAQLSADYRTYAQLGRERRALRTLYTEYLLLLTLAILFVGTWFALFLSKLVTVPIQALAQATHEIARGNLAHRIQVGAHDEIEVLVQSFNRMAADIEASRRQLETSGRQLRAANAELDARRRYTETLLESIPSAVISLGRDHRVTRINHAVTRVFGARASTAVGLNDLFDAESERELAHLCRKADRWGVVAGQLEILPVPSEADSPARPLTAVVTVAAVGGGPAAEGGYVLVLEDLTEVLRMQRVATWREVARRIAHEIRNPLTPIALSAQRIRRWVEGPTVGRAASEPNTRAIVAECAKTIEAEVHSLENLVAEFSAFARFPAPKPIDCNLNEILERALRAFDGRLAGIQIRTQMRPLPTLRLDPEEMRRVFVNLIDNAAEAVQASAFKQIVVGSAYAEGFVEAFVADSGPGISAAAKERLFLPNFSTKERGTGLGLAIVSRIIADHGGAIRVEDNEPLGTRFVIEFAVNGAAESTAG